MTRAHITAVTLGAAIGRLQCFIVLVGKEQTGLPVVLQLVPRVAFAGVRTTLQVFAHLRTNRWKLLA
uniref:Putative secreted protein n=1 Tax=Anopheles darlingi TaxID=43151 RepID=A0A2M4DA58_ANODA